MPCDFLTFDEGTFNDSVESVLKDFDLDDKIEKAIGNHDFSDDLDSAIAEYDFSEHVENALQSSAYAGIIKEVVDDAYISTCDVIIELRAEIAELRSQLKLVVDNQCARPPSLWTSIKDYVASMFS